MWSQNYHVIMQTSIGAKYGDMAVNVDQGRIDGILDILKKGNYFLGTIKENGECRIKGKLTTLMRTIPYEASGRVNPERLYFLIDGGQETFELTGVAVSPSDSGRERYK